VYAVLCFMATDEDFHADFIKSFVKIHRRPVWFEGFYSQDVGVKMKAKRLPMTESKPVEISLELHLAHVTPGRSRFILDVLYRDEEACEAVEGRLRLESFIHAVKARPETGSLVIEYNRNHKPDINLLHSCIEEALIDPERYRFKELAASTSAEALLKQDLQLIYCSQSASSLLKELRVDPNKGLATSEVKDRRLLYGSNEMAEAKPTSHWTIFNRQFANSQTLLLAGSAGLSFLTGGLFDVAMIGGVILVNGYVGYLSEARADEVISSIGHIDPQDVRVLRDGVFGTVLDHQLVVGDIISLSHGVVPADIRLIDSRGLMVDESPLTGESMPVAKHHHPIERDQLRTISDRRNLLFRGTIVTSGQGLGVVIATGENTEIGRVRRLVATAEQLDSPLQKDLEDIGRQTIMVSGAICAGVFALGVLRGRRLMEMLQTSIALAVAAVPEGLPTIGTTTMALGVNNLKKRNIVARRLNVLETLGSVEVLCLDKTGTLTMNEMVAEEGYFGFEHWQRSQFGELKKKKSKDSTTVILPKRKWSLIASLCTDCERIKNPDGPGQRWSGSSTEKAIIEVAELMGMDVESIQKELPRFKVSYRTESRQYMVTYHNIRDQDCNLAAVKGNPEQLLELSGWVLDQGVLRELTQEYRERLRDQNRELAKKGLRVLGFAFVEGQGMTSIQDQSLVWLGAVGLIDPTREGMVELIEKFHRAGIKTMMMTGDQTDTAKAVGKALGFNGNGGKLKTFDARDLKDLSLEAIADLAEEVQVFSRVSPTDKLRIVQALQQRGRIVAMTGDGINDSPALKAAHVGIAMGFQGTSAARESADIVLKDDNLEVLYFAIEQGRSVRANLRKSIRYLLGTNLSEILVMFLATAAGRSSPLNSMQLLWINLLTDVLPGLALALDPPTEDIMQQPPADPAEPLLSDFAKMRLVVEAGFISAGSLLAFELESRQSKEAAANTTAAFVSLTTSQILHTLSASAESQGLIRGKFPRNKRIYGAMGVAGGTIAMGVVSPWFRSLLGNEAMSPTQLGRSLAHGVWPVMLLEVLKLGRR
jgi:Ca2+-transporting ATPase